MQREKTVKIGHMIGLKKSHLRRIIPDESEKSSESDKSSEESHSSDGSEMAEMPSPRNNSPQG